MSTRLIKTEQDYHDALSRIEQLMDAKAGTAEADELELLSALVEMYEDKHYPVDPPDPIDAIKFRMEQQGLSQKDLVAYLGSKSKVSEVLNRKRPLTLTMMRSLHKGLGIPAQVLLREPGKSFPETMPNIDWKRFPVAEMVKRCWIRKVSDPVDNAEELMREFISRAGGFDALPLPAFRKSTSLRFNRNMDLYALTAWCLRVRLLAKENTIKSTYAKGTVNLTFLKETARLSYFDRGPLLAKEYLEKNGIHLIIVSHLSKTYLDGAAMLLPDGTPVVGMTLRHDRIDNFWFCLLHELAHLAQHLTSLDPIIIDDLDPHDRKTENEEQIEKEANEMAMRALIPSKVWSTWTSQRPRSADEVRALAEKLRIHPAIIAGRIRSENNNYKRLSSLIGNGEVRKYFPEFCIT